ncbi:hypothetical protein GF406_06675 [candidate division KSB1 bacterium]|nr:hypothetical protein [candidate division KSB1 bacterium]
MDLRLLPGEFSTWEGNIFTLPCCWDMVYKSIVDHLDAMPFVILAT